MIGNVGRSAEDYYDIVVVASVGWFVKDIPKSHVAIQVLYLMNEKFTCYQNFSYTVLYAVLLTLYIHYKRQNVYTVHELSMDSIIYWKKKIMQK